MAEVSELIASLSEQPVILAGVVVLVGLFVYAAMKRLVKLAAILVLGFVAVSAYFAYTGTEPPESLKKLQVEVGDRLKEGAQTGADEVKKKVSEEIKEAAREGIFGKKDDESE